MVYQEIIPEPPFDQLIKCYWALEMPGNSNSSYERVLPDGQMEMIFHYGDQFFCRFKNSEEIQPRSFLCGQLDNFIDLMPSGRTGIFGARFKTCGATVFFPFPLHEIKGSYVGLGEIGSEFLELEEQIQSASCTLERVSLWETASLKR